MTIDTQIIALNFSSTMNVIGDSVTRANPTLMVVRLIYEDNTNFLTLKILSIFWAVV